MFGSLARGDTRPESDVDFAVAFEDGRSLLDLSALRIDLMNAPGPEADVVTPNGLRPKLKAPVLEIDSRLLSWRMLRYDDNRLRPADSEGKGGDV